VWVPVPTTVGVYVNEHVADAPVPESMHAWLKLPVPLVRMETVPVGAVGPLAMSVTVTVQLVALLTTIVVGWQDIVVVVWWAACAVTANKNVPGVPAECVVSPLYVPVMRSCLGAAPVGVYVTWHVAVAPDPPSMHGDPTNVNEPAVALLLNATVPDGVIGVPGELSMTVAVQVVATPILTEAGLHETEFTVDRTVTVMDTVLLGPLAAWVVSPPYEAEMFEVPVALGVNVTLHVPPLNEQVPAGEPLKVPAAPVLEKVTVPPGVVAVPGEVSVTVAVHVVKLPTTMVSGWHEIAMLVALLLTVIATLLLGPLAAWVESPP
jgi:hypothetical protein